MQSHANRLSLEGKSALVTGASSGLGAFFARVLAEAGAKVAITARRFENLTRLADEITNSGGVAIPIKCDVTDAAQVEAAMTQAWDEFGRLDIVVNNAGVTLDAGSVPEKVTNDIFEATLWGSICWASGTAVGKQALECWLMVKAAQSLTSHLCWDWLVHATIPLRIRQLKRQSTICLEISPAAGQTGVSALTLWHPATSPAR